jgi:hypothetical protein
MLVKWEAKQWKVNLQTLVITIILIGIGNGCQISVNIPDIHRESTAPPGLIAVAIRWVILKSFVNDISSCWEAWRNFYTLQVVKALSLAQLPQLGAAKLAHFLNSAIFKCEGCETKNLIEIYFLPKSGSLLKVRFNPFTQLFLRINSQTQGKRAKVSC